jgi:hypothetical protein
MGIFDEEEDVPVSGELKAERIGSKLTGAEAIWKLRGSQIIQFDL